MKPNKAVRMKKKRGDKDMNINNPGWLFGWKEIGAYIGCGDRTAMTYWKKYGLPVNRLPSGVITAQPQRIDTWMDKVKISAKHT